MELIEKEFDALARNETVRPDHLEENHQIRRRFGQLISKAMGEQSDCKRPNASGC
jgi:tRNA U54 and U55 pseudouridine synthase Pus10